MGQTKNRTLDRFQGHLFDLKSHKNTVAKDFVNHGDTFSRPFTLNILEYIKVFSEIPRFKSQRDELE